VVPIIFGPSARSTHLPPLGPGPPGAARLRRARALLLPLALAALLLGALGSGADAIELTVEGLTVEDARGSAAAGRAPEVGDELYIRCRLGAQGASALDAVSFVFRVDGAVVRELRVPVRIGAPMAIGEYWTPATPGPHEIACEANPDRKVEEALYADNVRQRTVEVRPRGSAAAAAPAPAAPAPKPVTPPAPTPPSTGPSTPGAETPGAPAGKGAVPPPSSASTPAPPAAGPPATAATPTPAAPAPKAIAPPTPATPPATTPAGTARPDLAIVAVTTAGDPGCGLKGPAVTVRVTVKNVGEAAFVPPRNPALLETTVKIANQTALAGRRALPQLAPGAVAELEVVARNRLPIPDAGGLRYSVVVIVNGDRKAEEVTLDNNGEYVKAVFPPC
jgi:hypothetical protein